jgi:hypothetical protein
MLNKLKYAGMLLLLVACKQTPKGYMSYINDPQNGLTLERNMKAVHYKAQLLPADYQILLARRGEAEIAATERDSLRAIYNAYYYIKFQVGSEAAVPDVAMNYDAGKHFRLVHGKDSLDAAICQPIAGGVRNTYEYILAFPKSAKVMGKLELIYDNPVWELPAQQFPFKQENSDVTLF